MKFETDFERIRDFENGKIPKWKRMSKFLNSNSKSDFYYEELKIWSWNLIGWEDGEALTLGVAMERTKVG